MIENQYMLEPSERFPKEIEIPELSDILIELSKFGVEGANTIKLIDSTHDAMDVRLNYIIDKKWVLRFCNAPDMTEKRMWDLSRLIGRYQAMGFKCPAFIADDNGKYLHLWKQLLCYISEFIDLPLADDIELKDEDQLILQVAENVARFAETYRNVDLSDTMGMYSLFDLSPFDIPNGVDEKQDNFNQLISLLRSEEEYGLANRLEARHADIRCKLKAVYRELPRCVFQGDENFTNVLIDDAQQFAGFIDFNLAGTEVIVNQLVNLAGFDYDEKQTNPEGAEVRLEFAISYFQDHISHMLQVYHTTEIEQQALIWYAWIVMVAQWPNFCFFRYAIKEGSLKKEICELLSLIADLPEDRLLARKKLQLVVPDVSHEEMYTKMMDLWESLGEKIDPQLLSRYSGKMKGNVSYTKWLEWCEDDRTTGSNLSTKIPCTLYFLMEDKKEIIGSIVINHGKTHRGHLHAGIAPWHRGKGYGTIMLELALEKCREMGFKNVEIVPYKENVGAVKTILNNGGVLIEEFCEEGVWSQRYEIHLENDFSE